MTDSNLTKHREYLLPKADVDSKVRGVSVFYNGVYEHLLAHQVSNDKGNLEVLVLPLNNYKDIMSLPDIDDPEEKYFYISVKDQKFDEKTRSLIKNKINLERQLAGEVKFW